MLDLGSPLQAEGIKKVYGDKTAVDNISIHLNEGECLALLGPNGAGKTTLCEILEGLRTPDSGVIKIFGLSLPEHRDTILQKVGVQLQETNLYGRFTVKETLELFSSFYDSPKPVDEVIKLMQLESKENEILKNLSGGQRQRVYLGSSLINAPKLLFLDEPTTGLDPQSRRQIWDIIADIKNQGHSILLTTHYMEEAEVLADRIAIQDHGQIITEGKPNQLINDHIGKEIIRLTFENKTDLDLLADAYQSELNLTEKPVILENCLEIPTDEASSISIKAMEIATKKAFKISGLAIRKGSLEDVFLKLTGRSIRDA